MYRVEAIQDEMASAVRVLGGSGPAKEQNNRAARLLRMPVTVVERLRWKKIKRIPADIADAVREGLDRYNEEGLARAKHEAFVAKQAAAVAVSRLRAIDPDFYGPEIARLGRLVDGDRPETD